MIEKIATKYKKQIIILTLLLFLYISIPMVVITQYPFCLFNIDSSNVKTIEITFEESNIIIDDQNEVSAIIDQLNDKHYFFWNMVPLRSFEPYRVILYDEEGVYSSFACFSNVLMDYGIVFYTDMSFITSLIPE